ncbi:hypothetical protein F2P56_011735 [Juglans regia]|uniref:Retrotransposon Copia-like N-terminal domain-containing protein n=1 Tax=Juglans regia TaxID=51240 RepID=A0A833XUD5_JUGRE|nr:hypothetical protein F2P56_011735 [Juglans regia]
MGSSSFHVGNFVTLRLNHENYPLWREQFLILAESQDLVGILTGTSPAPTPFISAPEGSCDGQNTPNPAHATWKQSDRLLRGWLIGTLTEEALGLVIGMDSATKIWTALREAYAQSSQEREFQLRHELSYMRKSSDLSLDDYLRTFKRLCDNLAGIGKPLEDKEKVFSLLNSLGVQYEGFTTAMLKPPMPSYAEVVPLLRSFDIRHKLHATELSNHVAFYGNKQKGSSYSNHKGSSRNTNTTFSSKGKGFPHQNNRGSGGTSHTAANGGPPQCQICNKFGHHALKCWHRFDKAFQDNDIPEALAALTINNPNDHEWMTDTGASAHMTSNAGQCNQQRPPERPQEG